MVTQGLSRSSATEIENSGEKLAGKLPALLLEARRVAATVAQGVHGRRRAGPGETFWQFRNFEAGDSATAIDWRRSASSSQLFVREREWEAAHTVWIWIDLSPSMQFQSRLGHSSKADRALVLAFALASLLTDAGERVGIPGFMDPRSNRTVTGAMMETVLRSFSSFGGMPKAGARLSRHSEMVIFSDFLEPIDALTAAFGPISKQDVRGHLVQILDPAEESLPYHGRVEFVDDESGSRYIAERAESLQKAYSTRLAAHKAAIAASAAALGWTPFLHHTDRPAVENLLALHMHLSGLEKAHRAKGLVKGKVAENGVS